MAAQSVSMRYLAGDSLGKIVAGLEEHNVTSPAGRVKWNREAIDNLLSNMENKLGVLLQKTISTDAFKSKIMASWIGIFIPTFMKP